MNVQINWIDRSTDINTNITSRVISYEREQFICSGIGTATLTLEYESGYPYQVWDKIVIREEGRRKITLFLAKVSRNIKTGQLILTCQDSSKKLVDYFITTN